VSEVDNIQQQPESIGRYLVLGALGRGANGIVFKAQDPAIGRFVAIKTVAIKTTSGATSRVELVERLRVEARAAGNLRHPNIVTIFEVGEDYETPYLVMDYVDGETLAALSLKRGALSTAETLKILWQIASALDYAHDKGVLHKDIKPANILIDRAGQVMLLDFGIAAVTKTLTAGPGVLALGTPAYMSPEQILNKTVTHRADIFSLAIVAFELFSGKRPFPGDSFHAVVGNILNGRKLSLVETNTELPLALEAEFETALSINEDARFGSAQTMIDSFSKALGVDIVVRSCAVMMPTLEPREFEPQKKNRELRSIPISSAPSAPVNTRAASSGFSGSFAGPKTTAELFGDAAVQTARSNARRDGLTTGGIVLVLIFVALAGLGIALLIARPAIFNGEQITADAGGAANAALSERDKFELVAPSSDPAPANKSTAEFTDRQLLGVILNEQAPEAIVKDAIDEAARRNLGGLSAALLHPLRHDGYLIRIRALEVLGTLGDRRVVPNVMLALDDPDPLVRGYAARCLAALGDKKALPYLMARTASEQVSEVKESLRRAVDKLNGFSTKER